MGQPETSLASQQQGATSIVLKTAAANRDQPILDKWATGTTSHTIKPDGGFAIQPLPSGVDNKSEWSRTKRQESIRAPPAHTGFVKPRPRESPLQRARHFGSRWREPWPASGESPEGLPAQRAHVLLLRFLPAFSTNTEYRDAQRAHCPRSSRLEHMR